jgi:tRNA-modifying protein YgfZ
MTYPSPNQTLLEQYELEIEVVDETINREGAATGTFHPKVLTEFLPWGDDGCFVLATTGVVELEYAAIQKTVGVFDASCRGTIELTGEDRLECVGRMTTQKVDEMKPGDALLAFVTSRKGTVIADVIIRVFEDRILLEVDVTVIEQLVDHLTSYIVMEDVEIEDKTSSIHWLWCIGPEAKNVVHGDALLQTLPKELLGLDGVAMMVTLENANAIWNILVESECKPIGWFALNMARVERGAPVFMIDFDMHNLPHETNVVASRVRFDKGCYLGQEIIARMESLGQPKQKIMRLSMQSDDLPIAGSQLWGDASASGTPVGIVTSSAISPMSGSIPAVLAMVSKKNNSIGASVFVYIGTDLLVAQVEAL